jgi:hypothetical protein
VQTMLTRATGSAHICEVEGISSPVRSDAKARLRVLRSDDAKRQYRLVES